MRTVDEAVDAPSALWVGPGLVALVVYCGAMIGVAAIAWIRMEMMGEERRWRQAVEDAVEEELLHPGKEDEDGGEDGDYYDVEAANLNARGATTMAAKRATATSPESFV